VGQPTPQSAQAAATVAGNYTIRIDIYNEAGEIVKTLPVKHFSQPVQSIALSATNTLVSINDTINIIYDGLTIGTWDGTTNSGAEVSNGKYYIKVDNIDINGSVTSVTQVAMVARHLAHVNVDIYNSAGELIKNLDSFTGDAVTLASAVNLSSSTVAPSYQGGVNSAVTVTLTDGTTLVWNGRDDSGQIVTSGQYFLVVTSNDGQGGDSTVTKDIHVFHNGLSLLGSPVIVYPNPDSMRVNGSQVNFLVNSPNPMTLKINIYTIAGEKVDHIDGQPGENPVVWDFSGRGLASGVYLADIEIYDSMGAMQRQITKVLLVH
jgi:flagellar hook assembly protein FlgD